MRPRGSKGPAPAPPGCSPYCATAHATKPGFRRAPGWKNRGSDAFQTLRAAAWRARPESQLGTPSEGSPGIRLICP